MGRVSGGNGYCIWQGFVIGPEVLYSAQRGYGRVIPFAKVCGCMNLSDSIEKVARKSRSRAAGKECAQFKLCEIVDFKFLQQI